MYGYCEACSYAGPHAFPVHIQMETMDNAFSCVHERPKNEASYTYESSELAIICL